MGRWNCLWLCSACSVALLPQLSAAQSREPVAVTGNRLWVRADAGFAVFFASRYARSLELFDHQALALAFSFSSYVTVDWGSVFSVGGRAGFLHTGSARAGSALAIHYNLVDVGVAFGVRTRSSPRGDGMCAELLAEAGPLLGDASLSGVGQLVASFRVGASAMLGWQIRPERLIVGVRVSGS